MKGDVTRLPKWAQAHIADLERRARRAEQTAEELRAKTDPTTSRAVLSDYVNGDTGIAIEQYRRIKLWPHKRIVGDEDNGIEFTVHDGYIEVRSGWAGRLTVQPRSGNVLWLMQ